MPLVNIDISEEPQSKVQARAGRAIIQIQMAEAQRTEAQCAITIESESRDAIDRCGKMLAGAEPVCCCARGDGKMVLRVREVLCQTIEILVKDALWALASFEKGSQNLERFGECIVGLLIYFSGSEQGRCCFEDSWEILVMTVFLTWRAGILEHAALLLGLEIRCGK